MSAPLYGLVLAGGRSTRMGADKAALRYGGRTQLERAMELLGRHVQRAFVSVRAGQDDDALRARYPRIADLHEGLGPIAGILAAQEAYPEAAWLVLACDLPLLDEATLAGLVRARDPARAATAYRSSHDGLPEPLCAIYEPMSHPALAACVAQGRNCPRKFLIGAGIPLLDPGAAGALDNVNTPGDYATARARTEAPR